MKFRKESFCHIGIIFDIDTLEPLEWFKDERSTLARYRVLTMINPKARIAYVMFNYSREICDILCRSDFVSIVADSRKEELNGG